MLDQCEEVLEWEGSTHEEIEWGSLIEIQCLMYIVRLQLKLPQLCSLTLRHGATPHNGLTMLPTWS